MEIRDWWADNERERFWLEVTDRDDLGANLIAPKTTHSGGETFSYSLVAEVAPGDVVVHWWKQAGSEPAAVGFSTVSGGVEDDEIRWQAHGTYGRAGGDERPRSAWRADLINYTELEAPVSLDQLRRQEPRLRALRDSLRNAHGDPLYFPFVFSERRSMRTGQGYLFKLPADLVDAVPGLADVAATPRPRRRGEAAPELVEGGTAGRSRYQADPEVRRAIERHAMDWTLAHFESAEYLVEDVGATNPYDILALGPDDTELHIEVKGRTGDATTVELTAGEVKEARQGLSVLVVVDRISWERTPHGTISTSGGRSRIWSEWQPEASRLQPTQYRYLLPPDQGGHSVGDQG